jgi:hypothetical protein
MKNAIIKGSKRQPKPSFISAHRPKPKQVNKINGSAKQTPNGGPLKDPSLGGR